MDTEYKNEVDDEPVNELTDDMHNESDTTLGPEPDKELSVDMFWDNAFVEPVEQEYSLASLKHLINAIKEDSYEDLDAHQIDALRRILGKLVEADDEKAISIMGYSYYGGNRLYPCDWEASRDCFLYLMSLDEVSSTAKAYYANTLGYIFYYGRCNEGVPEYEKALKYYMYGAANQIFESQYKLADLYLHGYGTEKNVSGARAILLQIYDQTLKDLKEGSYYTKLPDVALRLGNMVRNSKLYMGSEYTAYYFYTLAEFAIKRRMTTGDHYGDNVVYSAICKELDKLREEHPKLPRYDIKSKRFYLAEKLISEDHSCQIKLSQKKKALKIKIKRLPKPSEFRPDMYVDCMPEQRICELIDSGVVYAEKVTKLWVENDADSFIADTVLYYKHKKQYEYSFFHHNKLVARISAKRYCRPVKEEAPPDTTEHTFASIVFQAGGREYDYLCDGLELQAGDKVVVLGYNGETEVTVVKVFTRAIAEMPLEKPRYKAVVRKAE